MAITQFIPTVWSSRLLVRLRKMLVFEQIVNTDYEGEISQFGDTVKINEIGPVTVSDYTRNSTSAPLSMQYLTDAQKELVIDQAKSFNFAVDDLDAAQSKPKVMDAAMDEAAYAVRDVVDQHIAGLYGQAGLTLGSSGSTITVYAKNVMNILGAVSQKLRDQGVSMPIWGVVPPWFFQKVTAKQQEIRTDNTGVLDNGFMRQITVNGIQLFESNNVSGHSSFDTTATNRIMFGTRRAISHAGQVSQVEAVRPDFYFADMVKGLYLYGSKVVRPNELVTLYATFADESTATST